MEFGLDCVPDVTVYEDPDFRSNTRTQTDFSICPDDLIKSGGHTLERLVPPKKTARIEGEHINYRYTARRDESVQPQAGGRWWPVWLIGRTQSGWWTICWYQVLDGTWIVVFWWYADIHVHLLDVRQ